MATMLKTSPLLTRAACLAILFAILSTMGSAQRPQEAPITITLAGQSMIRSDIRATAPAAVPVIQGLLRGDVVFTNFETAVADRRPFEAAEEFLAVLHKESAKLNARNRRAGK